jgi:outer membrane receptor protein involved in Fe transport
MRKLFLIGLTFVLCSFVALPLVNAQTINGSISGVVSDADGAAIPGANITVTNTETGAARSAVSNDEGLYKIASLPVGNYNVTAEKDGFAKSATTDVAVSVSVDTQANFQLGAGGVQATVQITDTGQLLEATQSQVVKTVDQQRIMELPGRNNLNGLALLNPGVLPNQNGRPGSGFAVNGNRTRSNNFTIDGANNNDQSLAIPRQNLPSEALGEFQIVTNTFAAEYGRNAGSYVNQITRSGTNDFHGTGFWVWGGNGLNSLDTNQQRAFNDNKAKGLSDKDALRLARSVEVRNTYGVTLGGPIKRNHTFFFTDVDFEDFRTTVSSARRPAFTQAAFNLLNANSALFAPGALDFIKNNFPVANDPTSNGSVKLRNLNIVCPTTGPNANPDCNVLGTLPLLSYNRGATQGIPYGTDFGRWLMKINTRINSKDQLSFRYLIDQSTDPGRPTSLPGQEVGQNSRNQSFTINDAYVLSSNLINEARVTYSRRKITFPEKLGFQFTVSGLGGAFNLGDQNFPQSRIDNVYELTENLAYTTGNHSLKFGYNMLRYDLNSFFAPNLRGSVSYGDINSFLFDQKASFSQFAGNGLTNARTYEHSWFAQDDWRVNQDLTLNLGLRYEYVTTPFGFFSNAKPDINNFGPRVGFAYNPKNMFDGKFVFRAGFGISYDQVFQNILLNNSRNYPRGVNVAFSNITGQRPYQNLPAPPKPEDFAKLGGNPLLLPVRLFSPNERVKQPMSKQWTISIQYQLSNDMVAKAEYIGTQGSNLVREVETNYGFTSASGLGNGKRLDPTKGSILVSQGQANSIYHAGQFTLEKRFSNMRLFGSNLGGLTFNGNYTYSAFISESDDILGGQANRTLPADPRNPKLDRARSAFDQPHRFIFSGVWMSPDLFKDNGALERIFGGWELSTVVTLASGTPYSVLNANNALGILPGQVSTVEGSQRVSVNPNGQFPLVSTPTSPNQNAYFIVNAADSGIVGTMGANTLRTGGTANTNLAVVKNIRTFGESQKLQLRVEITDLFNHRNFTIIPSNTIGNTINTDLFLNLGRTTTSVTGRTFTFGVRYFF